MQLGGTLRPGSRESRASLGDLRAAGKMAIGFPSPSQGSPKAVGDYSFPSNSRPGSPDELMSPSSRVRRDSVLLKLHQPKVMQSLDRLCREIELNSSSMQDMFDKLDVNGDGELEKVEMMKGLRAMGVGLMPLELDAVLRAFDTDGNGTVDPTEFITLLAAHAKSQGVYKLGQDVLEDDVSPAMCGFKRGARVRSLLRLPLQHRDTDNRVVLGHDLDVSKTGATVVGPGKKQGTVQVRFDSSSSVFYVRACQLKHLCEAEMRKEHDDGKAEHKKDNFTSLWV